MRSDLCGAVALPFVLALSFARPAAGAEMPAAEKPFAGTPAAEEAFPATPGVQRVEVDDRQQVTVEVVGYSLRSLLEDIAWRAGFQLRVFGVDDRQVSVRIEGSPLSDVLRRLLGRDPYLIGLSVGADGAARIAWLEVPGPHAGPLRVPAYAAASGPMREASRMPSPGGSSAPAASHGVSSATTNAASATTLGERAAAAARFEIPPKIFLAAFDGENEAEREIAVRAIEAQLTTDAAQRQAFLASDSGAIAEAVAPHRHAAAVLRTLAAEQGDATVRAKLEDVMGLLDAAVERVPAAHVPSRSPLAEFFE